MRLQFTIMGSRFMNTQTYVDIPDINWLLSRANEQGQLPVVTEKNVNVVRRMPLQTIENFGIELEITYKTGEPVAFNVFHGSVPLTHAVVGSCIDRHDG